MEILCDYFIETCNEITFYLRLNEYETTESQHRVSLLCNTRMFRVA